VSEAVTWRSKAKAPENPRQAAGRLMLNAILRSLLEGFFQANQPFRRSCSDVFPSAYPLPTHCSAAQSAPRQFAAAAAAAALGARGAAASRTEKLIHTFQIW
jgi:hypothetical protein